MRRFSNDLTRQDTHPAGIQTMQTMLQALSEAGQSEDAVSPPAGVDPSLLETHRQLRQASMALEDALSRLEEIRDARDDLEDSHWTSLGLGSRLSLGDDSSPSSTGPSSNSGIGPSHSAILLSNSENESAGRGEGSNQHGQRRDSDSSRLLRRYREGITETDRNAQDLWTRLVADRRAQSSTLQSTSRLAGLSNATRRPTIRPLLEPSQEPRDPNDATTSLGRRVMAAAQEQVRLMPRPAHSDPIYTTNALGLLQAHPGEITTSSDSESDSLDSVDFEELRRLPPRPNVNPRRRVDGSLYTLFSEANHAPRRNEQATANGNGNGNGNAGAADVDSAVASTLPYTSVVESNTGSSTYQVRRRVNANGEEYVHRIPIQSMFRNPHQPPAPDNSALGSTGGNGRRLGGLAETDLLLASRGHGSASHGLQIRPQGQTNASADLRQNVLRPTLPVSDTRSRMPTVPMPTSTRRVAGLDRGGELRRTEVSTGRLFRTPAHPGGPRLNADGDELLSPGNDDNLPQVDTMDEETNLNLISIRRQLEENRTPCYVNPLPDHFDAFSLHEGGRKQERGVVAFPSSCLADFAAR